MQHQKNVVVVLEDHQAMCTFYRDILAPHLNVLCAPSLSGALDLYEAHRGDVIGIISDGNVPGGALGPEFVRELRLRGFSGPVVGASLSKELRQPFFEVGVTDFTLEKDRAPDILIKLLKEQGVLPA